jgi:hypothetical protein
MEMEVEGVRSYVSGVEPITSAKAFYIKDSKDSASYPHHSTFETSFNSAAYTHRIMRAGVAQGGIVFPVLFSLYVNDMPTPSCHVNLALYADDAALKATSRNPLLLVRYVETYLNRLEL